jgi:hypothetical protein
MLQVREGVPSAGAPSLRAPCLTLDRRYPTSDQRVRPTCGQESGPLGPALVFRQPLLDQRVHPVLLAV